MQIVFAQILLFAPDTHISYVTDEMTLRTTYTLPMKYENRLGCSMPSVSEEHEVVPNSTKVIYLTITSIYWG